MKFFLRSSTKKASAVNVCFSLISTVNEAETCVLARNAVFPDHLELLVVSQSMNLLEQQGPKNIVNACCELCNFSVHLSLLQ